MQTPWGQSDHEETLAVGIVHYDTPGHGGTYLDRDRQQQVPAWAKTGETMQQPTPAWYERACDWAVPFLLFLPDIRRYADRHPNGDVACNLAAFTEIACKTAQEYHPKFWAALQAHKRTPSML